MREVRVVYRKFDGSLHWNYPARYLGEDEHGVWLGAPHGTPVRRGTEPSTLESSHVLLFPRDGWWTGCFNAPPNRTEIYCDVTTVPRWPSEDEVTMIDLDLDVRRRRADPAGPLGEVQLLDEDEFAAHQVKYGYPPDVIAAALATAGWLASAVAERREPFGDAYQAWLAQVA
jgi:protein associated with RNAse G/E